MPSSWHRRRLSLPPSVSTFPWDADVTICGPVRSLRSGNGVMTLLLPLTTCLPPPHRCIHHTTCITHRISRPRSYLDFAKCKLSVIVLHCTPLSRLVYQITWLTALTIYICRIRSCATVTERGPARRSCETIRSVNRRMMFRGELQLQMTYYVTVGGSPQ